MAIALGLEAGMKSAKKSWVSLEIPDTGLRSVSPRALIPIIESRSAKRIERRMALKGIGGNT